MSDMLVLTGWHASRTRITHFEPFLHVGSEAQARMRGMVEDTLHHVRFQTKRFIRQIDTGSWSKANLIRLQRKGHDAVVYLNRWEGLAYPELDAALKAKLDLHKMSDTAFRKAFPSTTDSWIIFAPEQVELISTCLIEKPSRLTLQGKPE